MALDLSLSPKRQAQTATALDLSPFNIRLLINEYLLSCKVEEKSSLTVELYDSRHCSINILASGWTAHRRNGSEITRKYVTTRNDGDVVIKSGIDESDGRSFLSVTIN